MPEEDSYKIRKHGDCYDTDIKDIKKFDIKNSWGDSKDLIGYLPYTYMMSKIAAADDEISKGKLGGGPHLDGGMKRQLDKRRDPKTEPEYECNICRQWTQGEKLFNHLIIKHNIATTNLDSANYFDVLLPDGRKLPIKQYLNEK